MSALKRNFTFERDGWTFHYIAGARRLQVYLPVLDRHSGQWDRFGEHTDEVSITLHSQAQGKLWAREWVVRNDETGGGTAEDYRREMGRWR